MEERIGLLGNWGFEYFNILTKYCKNGFEDFKLENFISDNEFELIYDVMTKSAMSFSQDETWRSALIADQYLAAGEAIDNIIHIYFI